jgi:hypothetical protein
MLTASLLVLFIFGLIIIMLLLLLLHDFHTALPNNGDIIRYVLYRRVLQRFDLQFEIFIMISKLALRTERGKQTEIHESG